MAGESVSAFFPIVALWLAPRVAERVSTTPLPGLGFYHPDKHPISLGLWSPAFYR